MRDRFQSITALKSIPKIFYYSVNDYYGRCPRPPSRVSVSPVIYLKSGDAS